MNIFQRKPTGLGHESHGAVTVVVTLLLIPMLLLAGTAVDMTLIHYARSAAQSANQLAANAALARYDALLKDLYGLFGLAEDEPELAQMVTDYIGAVFSGSDGFSPLGRSDFNNGFAFVEGYDLRSRDILRRQIEDYMKYAGSTVLVNRLLGSIQAQGGSIKASSAALDQQQKVCDELSELFDLYSDFYYAVLVADRCRDGFDTMPQLPGKYLYMLIPGTDAAGALGRVNDALDGIKTAFGELLEIYGQWYAAPPDEKEAIEGLYQDKLQQIADQAGGSAGLPRLAADAKDAAGAFRVHFQRVVSLADAIVAKQAQARTEVDRLDLRLADPNCEPAIVDVLGGHSDEYREMTEMFPGIEGMARTYQEAGYAYLDSVRAMLEELTGDGIRYRDKHDPGKASLTAGELSALPANAGFGLSSGTDPASSQAAYYAGFGDLSYDMPDGFRPFVHPSFGAGHAAVAAQLLSMAETSGYVNVVSIDGLTDTSGSKDANERQKNIINQIVDLARKCKDGLINVPAGAYSVSDPQKSDPAYAHHYAEGWSVDTGMFIDLITDPSDAYRKLKDKALITAYDISMFSHYTTSKPYILDGEPTNFGFASAQGIPIGQKVNYFYQSEWEYLLVGRQDARQNLGAVTNVIYDIRLICNFIGVFINPGTAEFVTAQIAVPIQTALSGIPFVGPVLGIIAFFLVHAAFAAVESAVDLVILRDGCKVPVLKLKAEQWICRPEGIANFLATYTKPGGHSLSEHNKEGGLSYEQYLLGFFLITGDVDKLVSRTGNLIEYNVVHYDKNIYAKANGHYPGYKPKSSNPQTETERLMTEALKEAGSFRLRNRHTDFNLVTEARMKFLFLPTPMLQGWSGFTNEWGGGFPVRDVLAGGY